LGGGKEAYEVFRGERGPRGKKKDLDAGRKTPRAVKRKTGVFLGTRFRAGKGGW